MKKKKKKKVYRDAHGSSYAMLDCQSRSKLHVLPVPMMSF